MSKADWTYLVDYWSDFKVQEKSAKASKSRSFQKMPHYNGSKSYARLRQDIMKKNDGKCTRLDVMRESRKRESKKQVNVVTLANNMHAVNEIEKLMEQREQGLNEKTDEQIFQDVVGKDTHGYLKAYGPGRSITQHFQVKPSRLDLAQEVNEVKKTAEQSIQEDKKEAEDARKEAEEARKDAESAKREAEETRNEVDQKIVANNEVWERRLREILEACGINSNNHYDPRSGKSTS